MTESSNKSNKTVLSAFVLAMITVAAIVSLRGILPMAEYGLSSAFYYILVAVVFFIPVSLISAELATGWPKKGGVYLWVKEAFGQKWGFLAIWLQWIQNVVWYPTVLSFAAATLAYLFNPDFAENSVYTMGVIVVIYWGAVLINLRGMKTSGIISSAGVILGTLIPGALLIVLGGLWLFGGSPIQIDISMDQLIPDLSNINNLVLAASILLAFGGMEMSAVHIREVKNPQKDYPRAMLVAVIITLTILILGTLAIAIVIPQENISLVAGIMQAFTDYFTEFNLLWLIPVIVIMMVFGVIGQVATWIAGPSRGLLQTADEGTLPPFFQKVNKNGMPVNVMIVQACIVTVLALVFLFMPSVSSSYWILSALTVQLYLIMYIVMFMAAIKLRYSQPNVKRAYKVPGGNLGMWIIAGIGFIAALAGLLVGFLPPAQLETGNSLFYYGFLLVGILVLGSAPLIIHHFRKPSWMPKSSSSSYSKITKKRVKKKIKKTARKKVKRKVRKKR